MCSEVWISAKNNGQISFHTLAERCYEAEICTILHLSLGMPILICSNIRYMSFVSRQKLQDSQCLLFAHHKPDTPEMEELPPPCEYHYIHVPLAVK